MMCGVSAFEREGGAKLGWNTVPQMCADFKLGEVTKLVHQLRDGQDIHPSRNNCIIAMLQHCYYSDLTWPTVVMYMV